jgi:3-phenylpropionate/cinnamic acid dioxygenase small subunit
MRTLNRPAMLLLSLGCVVMLSGCATTRLQEIEDRMAIEHLMVGVYPKALDTRDWKTYASLFAEDGELIQGTNVTKGPKAIEEQFSRPRAPRPAAAGAAAAPAPAGPPQTKHIVTNLDIKLDGDRATSTGYWQTISTRDGKTTIAGAGHYVDELVRVNGQWKFKKREIVNPARPASGGAAAPAERPSAR